MTSLSYDVLSLFKGDSSIELTTTDMISLLYPAEYEAFMDVLSNEFSSKSSISDAKAKIAKLQRKLLHHVSKLLSSKTLIVTRIESRGKKYYSLGIETGDELVVDKLAKRVVITKPSNPSLPLKDYEEKGITYLVEKESFFDRVNAILLQSTRFSNLADTFEYMYALFSQVNDVLAINDFEYFIEQFPKSEVLSFLEKLHSESNAYNKRICCIIDFTNISKKNLISDFLTTFFIQDFKTIHFVFDVTARELIQYDDLVKRIIQLYANENKKLNIKNDDLHNSPYFIGKAGPYTINPKDWKKFTKKPSAYPGVVCSQSSLVVDLAVLQSLDPSAKHMLDILLQLSKSLFISNIFQQRFSLQLHNSMKTSQQIKFSGLFSYSKNYIRFWNYQSSDDDFAKLQSLDLCKKEVEDFAQLQEVIYLSSGMPTRFSIGFALAYRQFTKGLALKEQFKFLELSNLSDLYTEKSKQLLSLYESAAKVFSDGFEVRIKRIGAVDELLVLQELSYIINTCGFPFFCYHFSEPIGQNKKLESFF